MLTAAANPDQPSDNLSSAQKIYKHVSPDGKVSFSDKPIQGSTIISVEPIQTFESKAVPSVSSVVNSVMPTLLDIQQTDPVFQYQTVDIVKPNDRQTIWSNQGDLIVEVVVTPKLRQSDKIALLLDGKTVKTSKNLTHFNLTQVPRGEHRLSAKILDQIGSELLVSPAVTIYLHKASTNMPSRD